MLSVVGCIDYLAYGTIFTLATFRPKIKLDVFFSARKAIDACREVVGSRRVLATAVDDWSGKRQRFGFGGIQIKINNNEQGSSAGISRLNTAIFKRSRGRKESV